MSWARGLGVVGRWGFFSMGMAFCEPSYTIAVVMLTRGLSRRMLSLLVRILLLICLNESALQS